MKFVYHSYTMRFAIALQFHRKYYKTPRLNRDFHDTTDGFKGLIRLDLDPYQVSFEAAQLYRSLRKKGLTIRSQMTA